MIILSWDETDLKIKTLLENKGHFTMRKRSIS